MNPLTAPIPSEITSSAALASPAVQLAILFISGALYCFVGYRVFKLMLILTGFLLAGGVSAAIVSVGFPDEWLVPTVVGVICGILGAGVLLFLYRLGVFVVGAAFGSLLAFQLLQTAGPTWAGIAIVLSGLLGGGLALLLERPVLSLAMASVGAWLMVASVTVYIHAGKDMKMDPQEVSPGVAWVLLLLWLVLTLFGIFTQYARPRKDPPVPPRK